MISPEVVTMKSTVRLTDVQTDEEKEYQLVYPIEADIGRGKLSVLSVLSSVGTAILGCRVGVEVRWHSPAGDFCARITHVSQSGRKALSG